MKGCRCSQDITFMMGNAVKVKYITYRPNKKTNSLNLVRRLNNVISNTVDKISLAG